MDPAFPGQLGRPAPSAPTPGKRLARGHWPQGVLLRALGVLEPMPRGRIRRLGGTGDVFIAWFHRPVRLRMAQGMLQVPGRTAMAWRPGMAQEFGDLDAAWLHSWIHLRGQLPLLLAERAGLPFGLPFPISDPDALERWLLELREEADRPVVDDAVIEALVLVLLRRLVRSAPYPDDALSEVRRILDADPCHPPALRELAALAECARQTLCTRFKRRYGLPPLRYALGLRLERAHRLLAAGIPPGQAGAECGWSDRRQFARCYRRRFLVAPSAAASAVAAAPAAAGRGAHPRHGPAVR